jgi:hypothetical protein
MALFRFALDLERQFKKGSRRSLSLWRYREKNKENSTIGFKSEKKNFFKGRNSFSVVPRIDNLMPCLRADG